MPKISDPGMLAALNSAAANAPQVNPSVALDRTYKQGQIQGQAADLANKPLERQRLSAETVSAIAAAGRAPYQNQEAQANAAKALAEARRAQGPQLTAEVRKAAIDGYRNAKLLDKEIATIEADYKKGPGSTSGLKGLKDYLPYTSNQLFDSAGSAPRGMVGNALSFTGGQLNTPREAEQAVGPYLPQSGDRDALILQKIEMLKQLRDAARDKAVAVLGGVPDEQGNPVPVDHARKNGLWFGASENLPPPNYGGDGRGTNNVEVNNAPPASYEEFRSALERGINSGQIKTVEEAQQFAAQGHFTLGDPKIIQANIDQVGHGQKANVATPVTEGVQKLTGPQAGLVNAADGLSVGMLPKLGAGLSAVTDRLTTNTPMSLGELYSRQLDANRGTMDQAFSDHPFWSAAGTAAGIGAGEGAIARIPAVARGLNFLGEGARAPAMDAAYSGLMSAGGSDWDNPGNVGVNALTGSVGGGLGSVGGNLLARGGGMAFRGVQNPAAQYLRARGVPMTVGQVLGGFPKAVENRLTSFIPQVGARYRDGFRGFNRAGFEDGLAPINGLDVNGTGPVPATTNGVIGPQGVDLALQARSRAYSNTLDPVTLARDTAFNAGETAASNAAGNLPDDMSGRANYAINRAAENFSPQDELTGQGMQQALRRFRRTTSENAPLPNGADLADVMRQAEGAYSGLVARQAPQVLPAFEAANAANRNVSILKGAVNRARNGSRSGEVDTFTPSQLSDEAAANARRYGGTEGTTNQPFFQLTRAGQQVLPSSVPDSGTAGRVAMLALPAALGGAGAGAGYKSGDTSKGTEAGLALAAALALGGTRGGQRAMTSLLLSRPDFLVQLGHRLTNRAPVAGMFGAGLGAGIAPSLLPQ